MRSRRADHILDTERENIESPIWGERRSLAIEPER
jgi:hypothetical protein